jgi:SAM-dependent methyltransferase
MSTSENNDLQDCLEETNKFYLDSSGFSYNPEKVKSWLHKNVKIPEWGNVLDLCCGDGVWSYGFQQLNPKLRIFGIDISSGGIERARQMTGLVEGNFLVGDVEETLPFEKNFFDIIFARGPFVFNQHDMSHDGAVNLIENWHQYLKQSGLFYSIYGSVPERMGTYTDIENVVLPLNKRPRNTKALHFEGGKYHHSVESFHQPFWRADSVVKKQYWFCNNLHVLVSSRSE